MTLGHPRANPKATLHVEIPEFSESRENLQTNCQDVSKIRLIEGSIQNLCAATYNYSAQILENNQKGPKTEAFKRFYEELIPKIGDLFP